MEFEVIRRNTTPIMIVEQFLKSLESGKLIPEQKLPPERELAKMFGVGRSSVREAIGVLVVMGYLEVIQGRGTFIRNIGTAGDYGAIPLENMISILPVFDLMESREILELKAVKLAAERAAQREIKEMQKAIVRMEECGGDIEKFYEADLEFHTALADGTDNAFLSQILKALVKQIHRFNAKYMDTTVETISQTIFTSKKIVALVAEGEGEKAAEWLYRHLNEVDGSLKDMVAERKKRGERQNLALWAKEDEN